MLDRSLHAGLLLVTLILLGAALEASATTVTITFDSGGYDPDMLDLDPGNGLHGPYDWVEDGARAAGFWAVDVGTPDGAFQQGHTHLALNYNGGASGQAEWQHAWTNDLQGLFISLDGGLFDVVSIDYRISRLESSDAKQQRLPWSWAADDPQLLLATDFDPTASDFESAWTAWAIDGYEHSPRPWITRSITGFENLDGFYVTSSAARVLIDNIVLEVHEASIQAVVPEPATGMMVGVGLAVLGVRGRLARESQSPSDRRRRDARTA